MGMAFDGDGDRLVLLTKKGRALLGDELAYLLLKTLKKKKKPLVLADVKCGDWFFKHMPKRKRSRVQMIKSGHSFSQETVREKKS